MAWFAMRMGMSMSLCMYGACMVHVWCSGHSTDIFAPYHHMFTPCVLVRMLPSGATGDRRCCDVGCEPPELHDAPDAMAGDVLPAPTLPRLWMLLPMDSGGPRDMGADAVADCMKAAPWEAPA